MIQRPIALASISLAAVLLSSCGPNSPGAVLIGDTQTIVVEGEKNYQLALAADQAGDIKDAIKLYNKTATEYPFAPSAADARYRQAQLLDQQGEVRDAFDTYDAFLKTYPTSKHHTAALKRLAEIAHDAQRGEIRTSFLGIKGSLPVDTVVKMLSTVQGHAPKTPMAARAQYAIGEAYLDDKGNIDSNVKSVAAFRQLVLDHPNDALAPEALFRVGKIQLENAERGNQNQANLDLSREAFNDYLLQYPGHKHNAEARAMIATLDQRELQRSYDIAEFYMKTGQTQSAKIYYRDILKRTKSGKLHEAAKARLEELDN